MRQSDSLGGSRQTPAHNVSKYDLSIDNMQTSGGSAWYVLLEAKTLESPSDRSPKTTVAFAMGLKFLRELSEARTEFE